MRVFCSMVYLNILTTQSIRLVRRAASLFDTLYFYIQLGIFLVFLNGGITVDDDGVMSRRVFSLLAGYPRSLFMSTLWILRDYEMIPLYFDSVFFAEAHLIPILPFHESFALL